MEFHNFTCSQVKTYAVIPQWATDIPKSMEVQGHYIKWHSICIQLWLALSHVQIIYNTYYNANAM